MKELNKLRLINWHLFFNDTVDIKNITFLTGSNGTGKSTVIDAMQIVLLGDTSGRNFNKAANDRTGRTLKGYLRCETGETSQGQIMSLRPGRFTSYIALQFKDTNNNEEFTLGIVFDCYDDDKEEHKFFYIKDKFPENNFATTNDSVARPMTYKELLAYLTDNYKEGDFQFFDTNIAYQNFLKHILGDLPDKYFTLLKKAVGFSPITNISNFITEFVCDIDYKVDISSMQTNIEQYKLLEIEAKKIQVKIDALNGIKEAYDNYTKIKQNLGLADYVYERANYEAEKNALDKFKQTLDKNNARIAEITRLINEKDAQIAELKSESESFLAKKVSSEGYSLSSSISSKKQNYLEKIANLEGNYNSLATTLNYYISQYREAIVALSNRINTMNLTFLSEKEENLLEEFKDHCIEFNATCAELKGGLERKDADSNLLDEFQNEMASLHSAANRLNHLLENHIAELSESVDIASSEIENISLGRKPFSPKYSEVKAAFEDEMTSRHPQCQVYAFCDLCDIRDKRWTKAIEAYIFNQKFNLFIDDEYYEEGAKILSKIARDYGFYSISLVDSRKLIERGFMMDDNSVAEEIITSHKGARAYANFLLGKLQKCETFSEARESGNGLLANCTGYRNFASFTLDERKSKDPFIGTQVSSETALNRKEDLASISKTLELYSDLNSYIKSIFSLEVISVSEIKTYEADIDQMRSIDSLNDDISRLDEQLSEGDLGEVNKYDEKIKAIEADINTLEEEKKNLYVEQGVLQKENSDLVNIKIPEANIRSNIAKDKLNRFDQTLVVEKYQPFFDKAMENLSLSQIKQQAQTNYVQTQSQLKSKKDKLIDLRTRYIYTYHLGYDTSKEDTNEEFDKELDNLSNVMLPNYLLQIEFAHKKAVKEFKDDFIYKLRTAFETIKSQIDELNLALKDVKFGRDSYRFSIEPNRDYLEYYNMITDDLLLNVGDAEDIYLEKYNQVMTNLFNMISDSTSTSGDQRQQIIENVEKFTDYRTYLVFDLLVKRGNSEVESSLAKTFKRQSGGETQTPFYISILASFAQLYRTNDENADTLRLVIFDEAFSKMDGSRIKEAVNLLRSFGLQAILSTPTEKVTDLVNEVDLTLVVMHDVKRNRSRIDRYQDRRKLTTNN